MTKRFSTPILLLSVAVGVACGSERVVEPGAAPVFIAPVFTTLEVTPLVANLFTIAPGNTIQLSINAWDQTGTRIAGVAAATYSSSAPGIADVSSSGVVTAAALGTAVITATLTVDGVTRTSSMNAKVQVRPETPGESWEISGVYDLTALITSSDPAWGIEEGTRQTAVIVIQHSPGTPHFVGTFAGFCATGASGKSCNGSPGFVIGTINPDGRVVIELTFEGSRSSYWYGEGTMASGQIVGRFGAGGHISGEFVAKRRQAQ